MNKCINYFLLKGFIHRSLNFLNADDGNSTSTRTELLSCLRQSIHLSIGGADCSNKNSLVDDRSGSFGDEAINTIVQEMENHREDVVVIFAGYPNEMEKFLQKNPGLRSRIAFHVPFADYNADELCQIAQMMGKSKGVCFEEEALAKLTTAFEVARKQSDFGNGRYVRNLLEQAKMNQASRLLEYDFDAITAEEIKTIKAEDIVIPEVKTEVKRTIGFAC